MGPVSEKAESHFDERIGTPLPRKGFDVRLEPRDPSRSPDFRPSVWPAFPCRRAAQWLQGPNVVPQGGTGDYSGGGVLDFQQLPRISAGNALSTGAILPQPSAAKNFKEVEPFWRDDRTRPYEHQKRD